MTPCIPASVHHAHLRPVEYRTGWVRNLCPGRERLVRCPKKATKSRASRNSEDSKGTVRSLSPSNSTGLELTNNDSAHASLCATCPSEPFATMNPKPWGNQYLGPVWSGGYCTDWSRISDWEEHDWCGTSRRTQKSRAFRNSEDSK